MTNHPAYYRDILNRILQEDDDDDIPPPPSRESLALDQFKSVINRSTLNVNFWQDFLGTRYDYNDIYVIPLRPFNHTLEVVFYVENATINVSPDMEITVDYPDKPGFGDTFDSATVTAWNMSVEKTIIQQSSEQVYKSYGITIPDFDIILWTGHNSIGVKSVELAKWIESQLQGIERVLKKSGLDKIKEIVSQRLTRRTNDK